VGRPHNLHEFLEHRAALVRRGRGTEAWAVALPGIGSERELRYEQQPAVDIGQAPVHFIILIRKYPVIDQAFGEPFHIRIGIEFFDRDQCKNAGLNFGDSVPSNRDAGLRHALNKCDHIPIPCRSIDPVLAKEALIKLDLPAVQGGILPKFGAESL
jgi:hypothetical protein